MTLKFHYHPLSSFCQKALIALYENATSFETVFVDLGDKASRAAFVALWPMAKMPVLSDEARDCTVAEATVVIEYLDSFYPGETRFLPEDPGHAWQVRMWDRFYDHYIQHPVQKITGDRLRPDGASDPFGVEEAGTRLRGAYDMIDRQMATRQWAAGGDFTLADCAASPALFYANAVLPFGENQRALRGYLERLMARPSYARALEEAEPYFGMLPMENKPAIGRI